MRKFTFPLALVASLLVTTGSFAAAKKKNVRKPSSVDEAQVKLCEGAFADHHDKKLGRKIVCLDGTTGTANYDFIVIGYGPKTGPNSEYSVSETLICASFPNGSAMLERHNFLVANETPLKIVGANVADEDKFVSEKVGEPMATSLKNSKCYGPYGGPLSD